MNIEIVSIKWLNNRDQKLVKQLNDNKNYVCPVRKTKKNGVRKTKKNGKEQLRLGEYYLVQSETLFL